MSWAYVEYRYPQSQPFHKQLLWLGENCKVYFGFKLYVTDSWYFWAGNGSHALDTGQLLTSYGTNESNAQANYLTTTKDSAGKVLAILTQVVHAKYVRVYIEQGSSIHLREWHPSIYLTAHEIVSGTLEITDQLADAPKIVVTAAGQERILIGENDSGYYGVYGYDGSGNTLFELSNNQTIISGWTLNQNYLSSTGIKLDPITPAIMLGSATAYLTGAGFWVGKESGVYSAHLGNPAGNYLKYDGTTGDLTITGALITGSTIGDIAETDSDTFTINADKDNVTASLILGRTTGGNATLSWNGTTGTWDKAISFSSTLGVTGVSTFSNNMIIGNGKYLGQAAGGQLFFNDTSNYVYLSNALFGVGTTAPGAVIEATSNSYAQLRLAYTTGSVYCDFTVGSGGNLIVAPTGDFIFDPVGNDVYPNTNYDLNLGLINKKFLTFHAAELWVETLVAQETMATIGGRILVGPTTYLTADIAAGATSISVKHNNLAIGDTVLLEAGGSVEFMLILSGPTGSGPYTHNVTRNRDGSGANSWYAGDAVFNTGAANDGFIDIYSVRGVKEASDYGPTIVGNVRNSNTYNDWTEYWAIGNLNGIYGFGVDTYGIGLGKYSGADYITIDTTNGIRFLDTNDVVQAQLSSSVWTMGRVAASYSNIQITAGAINLRTNTTNIMTLSTAGVITINDPSGNDRLVMSASGIYVGDQTDGEYVFIDNTGIEIYGNATKNFEVTSSGEVYVGYVAGGEYVKIDSNGIELYSGAVNVIDIDSSGYALITLKGHDTYNSSGRIVFDGSSYDPRIWANAAGNYLFIQNSTNAQGYLNLGHADYHWYDINLLSSHSVSLYSDSGGTVSMSIGSSYSLIFNGTALYPNTNNAVDLGKGPSPAGAATRAYKDVYAYAYYDVGDYFFLDKLNDIEELLKIKGSGKTDDRTGLELIDDSSLPEWMIAKQTKDYYDEEGNIICKKGDSMYDPDGKPFIPLKMWPSLFMGCIKQLYNENLEHIKKYHS